jgi:hypothetical protein
VKAANSGIHLLWKVFFAASIVTLPFVGVQFDLLKKITGLTFASQVFIIGAFCVSLIYMAAGSISDASKSTNEVSWYLLFIFAIVVLFVEEAILAFYGYGLFSFSLIVETRLFSIICILSATPLFWSEKKAKVNIISAFLLAGVINSISIYLAIWGVFPESSVVLPSQDLGIGGLSLPRSMGFVKGAGNNAILIGGAIPALVYLYKEKYYSKIWLIGLFLLLVLGALGTSSRNVWLVFFVITFLSLWKMGYIKRICKRLSPGVNLLLAAFVFLLSMVLVAFSIFWMRTETVDMRLEQHIEVTEKYAQSLLFGLGPGSVQVGGHILHDTWWLFVTSSGVFGLIVVFFRKKEWLARGWCVSAHRGGRGGIRVFLSGGRCRQSDILAGFWYFCGGGKRAANEGAIVIWV